MFHMLKVCLFSKSPTSQNWLFQLEICVCGGGRVQRGWRKFFACMEEVFLLAFRGSLSLNKLNVQVFYKDLILENPQMSESYLE